MFRMIHRNVICLQKPTSLFNVSACTVRQTRHIYNVYTARSSRRRLPSTSYIDAADVRTHELMQGDIQVISDFISEEEEKSLVDEVEPHLKRLRYEKDHWDDAIQGYRETEKNNWRERNSGILQRLRNSALPKGEAQITFVHVLDLAEDGYIKPHIDSVRFCGSTIAGLSLLSPCVMRFVHEDDQSSSANVILKRRSLYIITGRVRYNYTHEILSNETSMFRGEAVPKTRRISIICRTEPHKLQPSPSELPT